MDPRIIALYDEYTHAPLDRRTFLTRLAKLAGGVAAATALLPLIENDYARAAVIDAADPRITAEHRTYKGKTGDIKAYLATPKAGSARRGSVIVIHENRGLNPHIEDVARRAALEGFTALAPDALSPLGGTPADADAARDMSAKLDRADSIANSVAAIAYLKSRSDSNGAVGAVGFCWGGGMVNQMAANAPDLSAAVPFYGSVPEAADAAKIKARLQLHYAGNDQRINAGIPAYEAALKAANVRYELHMYPGVEHAFHNDTAGERYNKAAADLAWSRTMAFFKDSLRGVS